MMSPTARNTSRQRVGRNMNCAVMRTCPPRFTFFCNRPDVVTDNYKRFIENRLRASFPLEGTPIRIGFKKKD